MPAQLGDPFVAGCPVHQERQSRGAWLGPSCHSCTPAHEDPSQALPSHTLSPALLPSVSCSLHPSPVPDSSASNVLSVAWVQGSELLEEPLAPSRVSTSALGVGGERRLNFVDAGGSHAQRGCWLSNTVEPAGRRPSWLGAPTAVSGEGGETPQSVHWIPFLSQEDLVGSPGSKFCLWG